jgi:hypothetical protein
MINLNGSYLQKLPLQNLLWKRDLIYFEGPLLSEFSAKNGEKYLKYWCDCNEDYNRWMLFRIKEEDRLRLVLGEIPLISCIQEKTSNFVFFIDEGENDSKYQLVDLLDIPQEYLPEDDACLNIEEYSEDKNIASLVFENNWKFDDLKEVYRKITQIYDFMFVAKKQLGTSGGMPWQDGFSAMHFYNKLKNIIPQQSNSSLDAIHYASPGYMKMRMDSDIANTTYEAIEKYKQEKSIIDQTYTELSNRIKELDLNSFTTSKAISEFSLDNDCQKSYKLLRTKLYCIDDKWLNKFADSDFERCKILMAHTRRLKNFYSFIEDGRIRVVTSVIN